MALSDPFQTTYGGAFRGMGAIGEGIQQAAQTYAQARAQQKAQEEQHAQALETLRMFGIIRDEEPTTQDYIDNAKRITGKDIKVLGYDTLSPEKQHSYVTSIYKALGIKPPEAKTVVDLNAMKNVPEGTEIDIPILGIKTRGIAPDSKEKAMKAIVDKATMPDGSINLDVLSSEEKKLLGALPTQNIYTMFSGLDLFPGGANNTPNAKYKKGQKLIVGGKQYTIVGFADDGEPMVE